MTISGALVSIGVPTYNRPGGLRRTLECLSAQCYPNIEILVSDNCSPSTETEQVVAQAAARDWRIRYFRQEKNLGPSANFRFVLEQATGQYFMWAADDDEWAPDFIDACLAALASGAVSAMCAIETSYRLAGRRVRETMPELSMGKSVAENLNAFLRRPTPGLFYGLHRRAAISFCLRDEFFDLYDCYFVLNLIATGGVALVPSVLYTAGVDAAEYQIKPMGSSWGSGLRFQPFYQACRGVLQRTPLSLLDRLRLEMNLTLIVARLALVHDGRAALAGLRKALA